MLGDINFQRKKCGDYSQPAIQSDQNKTIYDFVLRQDSQIKTLEKELASLKKEFLAINKKIPLYLQREDEYITKSDLAILMPTLPSKEELKLFIKKEIQKEKEELQDLPQMQITIKTLAQENEENSKALLALTKKINDFSNEMIKFKTDKDDGRIITQNDTENSLPRQLADFTEIKEKIEEFILQTNKRLSDFDNDFDRLIESLKTQFSSVQDILAQLEETKIDQQQLAKMISSNNFNISTPKKSFNLGFKFNTIDGDRFQISKSSSLAEQIFKSSNRSSELKSTTDIHAFHKQMRDELRTLKKEINNDLENINLKILDELQRQSNEIKNINQEINIIASGRKLTDVSTDEIEANNLMEVLAGFEEELKTKPNIEQLNYALEAQAKINDAFCSANRIARWSWSGSNYLPDKKGIVWSIQNINTSLDIFDWENGCDIIEIKQSGIYRLCCGVISDNKPRRFFIAVNNASIESEDSQENIFGINTLERYLAIGDEAKIKVGIVNNNVKEKLEAFLEIKKLI